MSISRHSLSSQSPSPPASLAWLTLILAALCLLPAALTGCSHASASATVATATPQAVDSAREQLALIPLPTKSRYLAVHELSSWENPYLTVQQNIATLHVTLADANPSDLGTGGMLRPEGARRQDLTIRLSNLPDALNAVPETSWPYGRVIAIEEAHNVPPSALPAVRRSIESTIKTLGDLGIVVDDWTGSGGQR